MHAFCMYEALNECMYRGRVVSGKLGTGLMLELCLILFCPWVKGFGQSIHNFKDRDIKDVKL